jgi:hypothetical protein
MSNNKTMIALLGVVAVLLAVIAGILLFKPSSDVPGVDPNAAVTANQAGANQTSTPNPSMPTQPAGPFDPAKATKVPASETPEQFVKAYFDAVVKGDYTAAYNMLPTDMKASYASAQAFGEQLKSYGASGFTMGENKTSGDQASVSASLKTSGGDFGYTWTFVKYNGAWVVKSRALSGMGQ